MAAKTFFGLVQKEKILTHEGPILISWGYNYTSLCPGHGTSKFQGYKPFSLSRLVLDIGNTCFIVRVSNELESDERSRADKTRSLLTSHPSC